MESMYDMLWMEAVFNERYPEHSHIHQAPFHFIPRFTQHHHQKYEPMIDPGGVHYVSSDGAPSHFKNRFTISFLLKLLLLAITVVWGFQAPSHGKVNIIISVAPLPPTLAEP